MAFFRRAASTASTAGLDAVADVLAIAPTLRGARQTERRDVEYALELRVHATTAPPSVTTHVCRVPWDKTPRLGQRVPVRLTRDGAVDRILWDAVPSLTASALAAGAAAQRGDAAGAAAALGFTLRDE